MGLPTNTLFTKREDLTSGGLGHDNQTQTVHSIGYSIDALLFSHLCNRKDLQPVDAAGF